MQSMHTAETAAAGLASAKVASSVAHLDRARKQMTVVRQTGGKRRAVVEDEWLAALGAPHRLVEGVILFPPLQRLLFGRRKV